MKQHISFFILVLAVLTLNAAPVDVTKAQQAGTHFLQSHGLIKDSDSISLYTSYPDNPSAPRAFYVFNYNNTGFVLVSADDRCTPILGHSCNGIFVTDSLPANMASWLNDYTSSRPTPPPTPKPPSNGTFSSYPQTLLPHPRATTSSSLPPGNKAPATTTTAPL